MPINPVQLKRNMTNELKSNLSIWPAMHSGGAGNFLFGLASSKEMKIAESDVLLSMCVQIHHHPLLHQVQMITMHHHPLSVTAIFFHWSMRLRNGKAHIKTCLCLQDRAIGKPVLQIEGSIPAVNYIQLPSLRSNSLSLTGQYLYCQVTWSVNDQMK